MGKILWGRAWQPTPVFLPGEFHGQRSLAGYSPWGHKESDMTEQLTLSLYTFSHPYMITGKSRKDPMLEPLEGRTTFISEIWSAGLGEDELLF